jgi:hypothetical protein
MINGNIGCFEALEAGDLQNEVSSAPKLKVLIIHVKVKFGYPVVTTISSTFRKNQKNSFFIKKCR